MTVIKINAITVPAESGDELAQRFAARAGAVDGQPGFEGFELLKPVDGRTVWLVVTRWADEDSYQAWRRSEAFGRGHGHGGSRPESRDPAGGDTAGGGHNHVPAGADQHSAPGSRPSPLGTASELWNYEVAVTNPPS